MERGSALEALVDAASGILAADSLDGTLGRIAHHLRALLRYDDLTVYEVDDAARMPEAASTSASSADPRSISRAGATVTFPFIGRIRVRLDQPYTP